MSSLAKERADFIEIMRKEGVDVLTSTLIMRHATTIQRLAVEACNRELTPAEEKRDGQAMARIRKLLEKCETAGKVFAADFNGDPRGCCTKLRVPSGRTNNWGGTHIYVPTRRF